MNKKTDLIKEVCPFATYDIVKAFVSNKIGKFVASEVISSCPSVGRTAILNAIKKLVEDGIIIRQGNAKNTYYINNPNF